MRISDWSSDVCSSDLDHPRRGEDAHAVREAGVGALRRPAVIEPAADRADHHRQDHRHRQVDADADRERGRSEEHTSELQSLMRISYAVFCLKKKKNRMLQYNTHKTQLHHPLITYNTLESYT